MPRSSVQSAPLAAPAQKVASAPAYNRPAAVEGVNPSRQVEGVNPSRTASAPVRAAAPSQAPAQANVAARTQPAEAKRAAAPVDKAPVRPTQVAAKPAAAPAKTQPAPEAKAKPQAAQVVAAPQKQAPAKEPVKAAAKEPVKEVAKVAKVEPKAEKPAEKAKLAKAEPAKPVAAAPAPLPKPAEPVKVAVKPAPAPQKAAAAEPAKPAEQAKPAKEPEATASLPAAPAAPSAEFRWPARGRVISGFGGSGGNEGINIAVPDGTPVKAAESGTVAYAGSEVKGYGNLVLIRHDNGYVSAYAHNGDIEVKRGQKVNRGQTIAKSGQSGNVTSPQLHFEIRKGAQPVDPMQYLASN
jgi:murein DD-endopeptidase MepM/ murein hydrolase activator NlpD